MDESLPTWIAFAAAACGPDERPAQPGVARDLMLAVVEYTAIIGVARWERQGLAWPPSVADALSRVVDEGGAEPWGELLMALMDRDPELLGIDPDALLEPHDPVGHAFATITGRTGTLRDAVRELLSEGLAIRPGVVPALRAAALSLLARGPGAKGALWHVCSVLDRAHVREVRYRELVGTAWPRARVTQVPASSVACSGQLALWLDDTVLPLPRWLAWYDEPRAVLRVLRGRQSAGDLVFAARHPAGTPLLQPCLSAGAPPFLSVIEFGDATAQTEEMRVDDLHGEPPRRTPIGPRAEEDPAGACSRLCLRVLNGRTILSYHEIIPGNPVVVGRSEAHADLVLPHPKVSRRNTTVWVDELGQCFVRDMGSKNGTWLRDVPVGRVPVQLQPTDTFQVGPALLRLDVFEPAAFARLDDILGLAKDPGRDPVSGLLPPEALARRLRDLAIPVRVVLVIQVDQLSAFTHDLGPSSLEEAWIHVSRLLLLDLPDPTLVAQTGIGEAIVISEGDRTQGGALAQALQCTIAAHAGPLHLHGIGDAGPRELTLTIGVVEVGDAEAFETSVERGRQLAFLGRARRGPGRIHGLGKG